MGNQTRAGLGTSGEMCPPQVGLVALEVERTRIPEEEVWREESTQILGKGPVS